MLVLTRRTGESIVIGNDVVVTVLDVRGDQVRIGIDAPRAVKVHREEVFRQVVASNAEAVASKDRAAALRARLGAAGRGAQQSRSTRPPGTSGAGSQPDA